MSAKPKSPAEAAEEKRRRLDERLDEALEETFPASDPPAVHETRDPPPKPGKTKS